MAAGGDAVSVLLAQFEALRAEIASRSQAQASMMQLTITALGAIAALAFSEHGEKLMLLVVPIVSAILGLIWIDHAANITNLGNFIRTEIMPALKAAAGMANLPDYEVAVVRYEQKRSAVMRLFGLPPFLVFLLTPAVTMVLAYGGVENRDWMFWTLFGLDLFLMAVFTAYWLPWLRGPRRTPPVA